MRRFQKILFYFQDERFLEIIHDLEKLISKLLAMCLIIVIFVSIFDLIKVLSIQLAQEPFGFFGSGLVEIFGLFLNVLIALELLENITGYLRKNVVQIELVVITAVIAVARKIIIFDFNKYHSLELASLGFAILALSFSYWLIKYYNSNNNP
ncbi:MAG: phosphate-starvation-inducible PsiE family protein [Cyanobacteriota bacterium]|jgi:uncharacterized membrane protein (DUF373 family)